MKWHESLTIIHFFHLLSQGGNADGRSCAKTLDANRGEKMGKASKTSLHTFARVPLSLPLVVCGVWRNKGCNYGADIMALNIGRFAGSGVWHMSLNTHTVWRVCAFRFCRGDWRTT